jgi:quinol monooxygenase YgiN
MAIYMTAQWRCRPGSEKKVEEALRLFVSAVRQNEPDTRMYTALQQKEDATNFMTSFIFENDAAREFHSSTDWVKRFTDVIYPENQAPVVFTEYRLIASTDSRADES